MSMKRHWTEDMEQKLQDTQRGDSIALQDDLQKEQWFLELYGKKLPLKKEEYNNLLRKEVELKQKLKDSKTISGRIARWATAGGASLGAIADLVVHIPSLGVTLLMVPPGTITVAGTALGRLFQGKSPSTISSELHEVDSARKEVGAYLSNLQTGLKEVSEHRKAREPVQEEPKHTKQQTSPRRRKAKLQSFDVIG